MSDQVIVTGHLLVDADDRDSYLDACLEFVLAADPVDPARIVVLERWRSQADVEAFRGAGIPSDLGDRIRGADVAEYDVADVRRLT